jgi:four helix bundle protein
MGYETVEEKRIYGRAERVADFIWEAASQWPDFARRSVGLQLVRAGDSIGANIAEGFGRFHPADVCKFFYYARGSLRETVYWLRRAYQRRLITDETYHHLQTELEQLAKELNQSINHQKTRQSK